MTMLLRAGWSRWRQFQWLGYAEINAEQESYSFTNFPLGEPHPRRIICVAALSSIWAASLGFPIATASIRGVGAGIHVQAGADDSDYAMSIASIFSAVVPSGSTGTIFVDGGGSSYPNNWPSMRVGAWRLVGYNPTPFHAAREQNPTANIISLSLNVPPEGAICAAINGHHDLSSPGGLWTGIGIDQDLASGTNVRMWGSRHLIASTSPQTLTFDVTGSTNFSLAQAAVSFAPSR
jgi:hypothetical protein